MNYYELLSVKMDATEEAIRSAFRRLARQYHPDAGEGSSSEKFLQISRAYETLMDPARRKAYDRSLASTRIPVRVVGRAEPTRQWRNPREPRRTNYSFAFGMGFEVDSLFEQLFRAFEAEWLFTWPFER